MSYYNYWKPYVPVAARRAQARKEMEKLRKKGKSVYPVEIEDRAIAKSFWGKGWCSHLESFSDYANRLPRGRTYVRNGSVCHLDIQPNQIEAMVSGSSLYQVSITITPLSEARWKEIKAACAGQIGSMLELLQGKFSKEVMAIVANRETGLFPTPDEIQLRCSCPDWAYMCKHVAAALYGVGNRLDLHPELLFVLRNVDAEELIAADMAVSAMVSGAHADEIETEKLGAIFDIELDADTAAPVASKISEDASGIEEKKRRPATKSKATTPVEKKPSRGRVGRPKKTLPRTPRKHTVLPEHHPAPEITSAWIKQLRNTLGLTVPLFAYRIGVTISTIKRWENISGPVNMQQRLREKLLDLWNDVALASEGATSKRTTHSKKQKRSRISHKNSKST